MDKKWIDYYSILQVHHHAEPEVVEGAYKKLCKKYHPDINKNYNAEDKMKMINAAYEVLSDCEKRKLFHNNWVDNNKKNTDFDNKADFKKDGIIQARIVATKYFNLLINSDFEKSYQLLSSYDKKKTSLYEYVKWQKAVNKIYRIGSIQIKTFKFYTEHKLKNRLFNKTVEFEISTKEKNCFTNKIDNYSFAKSLVFENNQWFVYLGFDDVKSLTQKFEILADREQATGAIEYWINHMNKIDEYTKFPNKVGFYDMVNIEFDRYKRYGRTFTIAVIKLLSTEQLIKKRDLDNYKYIQQAAHLIKKSIRTTDVVAHFGKGDFYILLPETSLKSAQSAINKLLSVLTNCYSIKTVPNLKIYSEIVEHQGSSLAETIQILNKKMHCL